MQNSSTAPPGPLASDVDEDHLFKELVEQHSSRLYRFIIKHIGNSTDAQDLTQQTFVEAVQSYRKFRGESQLSTWLYGIALNLVRNHLSRSPERRYEFLNDEFLDGEMTSLPTPDAQTEQNQAMAALRSALDELPAHMRDLLLLVGTDDISYEEAATMLMVPVGTVRSRLSRARSALKGKLRDRGVIDD
ncbi:MAG: RNA polymerase sigma factor [Candidimonas sp.]|jgi:RNA polymerase sigma factor (sigma-70 family)